MHLGTRTREGDVDVDDGEMRREIKTDFRLPFHCFYSLFFFSCIVEE